MQKIKELYKELIEAIFKNGNNYDEEKLSVFVHAKGNNYHGELMIIGRAVNGWGNNFTKDDIKVIDDVFSLVENDLINENLNWVKDQWGPKDPNKYNTKKSAFWRVSRLLAKQLSAGSEFEIDSITWNNLYKVSKAGKGNPSGSLMYTQRSFCQQILKEEIGLCNPDIVVFLTGLGWASPFISDFEKLELPTIHKYVKFVGNFRNSLIIVSQHPQCKPEKEHVEEILEVIKKVKENLSSSLMK